MSAGAEDEVLDVEGVGEAGLAEFLLARIHDDESVARAAEGHAVAAGTWGATMLAHTLRHDPARVLAECEAKRKIVRSSDAALLNGRFNASAWWSALRIIAGVYIDHPDYREEWRAE